MFDYNLKVKKRIHLSMFNRHWFFWTINWTYVWFVIVIEQFLNEFAILKSIRLNYLVMRRIDWTFVKSHIWSLCCDRIMFNNRNIFFMVALAIKKEDKNKKKMFVNRKKNVRVMLALMETLFETILNCSHFAIALEWVHYNVGLHSIAFDSSQHHNATRK